MEIVLLKIHFACLMAGAIGKITPGEALLFPLKKLEEAALEIPQIGESILEQLATGLQVARIIEKRVKEGKTTAKERKEIKGYQKKGYTVQNTTFKD